MNGISFKARKDNWLWESKDQKFREDLIESSSICKKKNNFIGIPCKSWIRFSEIILSFSKCKSSKYMTYSTLFINKNFHNFLPWLLKYINSTNRWKIILVANKIINSNISWAYKFFNVPDNIVSIWDNYSAPLLSKLSDEVKKKEIIFFISAGPATNIIISYLSKINDKNIYIDFGSAIEIITKGYSTRSYPNKTSLTGSESCEPFLIKSKRLFYKI